MRTRQLRKTNPHVAAEFSQLFGPPPLFKTEHKTIYEAILQGLVQEERPRSFIARILLRDVADVVYQRLWLRGVGSRLIRKGYQAKIEKTPLYGTNAAQVEQLRASANKQLAQLAKGDGVVDEVAAFPHWIEKYERVQTLLDAADRRLSDTLKLLDEYRDGLGRRVRQVADEIVDVEFEESSLLARERQVATPPSSIEAIEPAVPSTEAMSPSPTAESVASPVEVSASSRPASVRQRRRLQPAAIQRGRRPAPSTPSRGQSNATSSSGDTEPGKVPAPRQA
jgi:hypothetical protein